MRGIAGSYVRNVLSVLSFAMSSGPRFGVKSTSPLCSPTVRASPFGRELSGARTIRISSKSFEVPRAAFAWPYPAKRCSTISEFGV